MEIEKAPTIRVGGFNVKLVDDTSGLTFQDLMGQYHGLQHIIRLRTDVPEEQQVQTLLHEIGHAISSVYSEANDIEEAQMANFTQGWFQVLRDNPFILGVIQDLDRGEITCNECGSAIGRDDES